MPKTFAITPVKSRLTLDANGEARVTFNVSNTSEQALRARVTPVALQSAQRSWLSVEGDSERSFSADQTHQFTVRIAVPPGTAAGDFSLRLDCAATHNPDELFTEGPVVAFERPVVEPKEPFPWWVVVAAAVLLLVVGTAVWWFVLRDDLVTVPNLFGKTVPQAQEELSQANLSAAEQVIDRFTQSRDELPPGAAFPPAPGTVVGSRPAAGEKTAAGSRVELEVEVQSVQVPNLKGLSTDQGISRIQSAGLTLGQFEFRASTNEEKAKIVAQEPEAPGRVPAGGAVDLWVGSGPRVAGPFVITQVLSTADLQRLQQFKHREAVRRLLEPENPDNQ